MDNKPKGYYGPEESMRPDSEPEPKKAEIDDGYFNPGQTYLDHKARCDSVQRRGVQMRLKVVEHNLTIIGLENLTTTEQETLAVVEKELAKVEGDMVAAGQAP